MSGQKVGTDAEPLVRINGVSKVYQPSPPLMRMLLRSSIREPVLALNDVTFEVRPGEIVAVVGPNGAGKSTLFRILTGLTTPSTGQAWVGSYDVVHQAHRVRRLVGFSPSQEHTLLLRHTCLENLQFHGRLHGMRGPKLRRRIDEVLEFVGLSVARDRVGFALSSGMKARLQLARAMLHRPRVLILDEPTASIDPLAGLTILEMIQGLADRGTAILISSHRLEEIEALHDRVLLLDQGAVVYEGNLDDLRKAWHKPHLRIVFMDHPAAVAAARRLAPIPDLEVVSLDGSTVIVSSEMSAGHVLELLDGHLNSITDISPVGIPLMDLLAMILRKPT